MPVRSSPCSKHSCSLPLSTTVRKIEPTSFKKTLLSAVSLSPKVAFYVNFATPTPLSPPLSKRFRLAFDESQQGGKAGFTVIGANLPCSCLQCLTGDQEQTKAGTGGEKLQEALVDQLAHKAIGFLGPPPLLYCPPTSPTYLQLGTTISMFKPMVALLHTSAKRPLLILWRKMPNQTKS